MCCRFWSRDDARDKCAAGVATEDVGEEVTIGENMEDGTAGKLSENSQVGVTAESDDLGVYDFKDNKTTGTVTVTKEWTDCSAQINLAGSQKRTG